MLEIQGQSDITSTYKTVVNEFTSATKHKRLGRSSFEIGTETTHENIKLHKYLTLSTITFTNSSTEND
jgi:hypothetical protein